MKSLSLSLSLSFSPPLIFYVSQLNLNLNLNAKPPLPPSIPPSFPPSLPHSDGNGQCEIIPPRACIAGEFQVSQNPYVCTECAPGRFSTTGGGTQQESESPTEGCAPCPEGRFSPTAGGKTRNAGDDEAGCRAWATPEFSFFTGWVEPGIASRLTFHSPEGKLGETETGKRPWVKVVPGKFLS